MDVLNLALVRIMHNKVRLTNITLQFVQNVSAAAAAALVPAPKPHPPVISATVGLISSRVLLSVQLLV